MGQHFKLATFLIVLGIMPLSAAENNDNAKIQGTWKVTSREHAGKNFPGENLGEFLFSEDSFTMRGKRTLKGKYKLNSSKTPKHLDLNFTGENGDVVPSQAIYKLEGHRLTICAADVGQPRPTEFKPALGSEESLVVLVRAKEKQAEIKNLGLFVGDWTSEVTSNPSIWNPKETKLRTSNHAEMVLDGWFLQHIEVNHVVDDPKKVTKAIWFSTYDSEAKEYVTWFFQSSGLMGKSTGTWSEETQTSAFTPTDLPPNTSGTHKEKFKTKDFIEGSYVIKANDGRTMFDMSWTRTRQKGLVPNPLRKQWTEIGTPIQPMPDEVKKLEAYLGEWDAEFVNRPSVVSPNGGTSKGKMTGHWVLDGRFLYGTTDVGNHKSIWIAGYDPNKKAYRYIRMTNTGKIDDSLGEWDEKKQAFRWKIVNERPGMTRTSTSQIVGKGALNTHVVAKDKVEKIHMDLTIKATRRK